MIDAIKSKFKKHFPLWIVLFCFLLIYGLITFVNHYNYRTYALDLGMFNHALYLLAHGKPAVYTLGVLGEELPFLGTHFSPIMWFYIPFYYIFGTYSLLVIQVLSILFGGIGIYKIANERLKNRRNLSLLIVGQFLGSWAIFSALSFDFHNNVIGAMLIPWFFYYLIKNKKSIAVLFAVLIAFTHEIMPLFLIFILVGYLIEHRKNISKKIFFRFFTPLTLFLLIYGVAVIFYFMPYLQNQTENLQMTRYTHIGGDGNIISAVFLHPWDTFKTLFINTNGFAEYDYIKYEFYKVWMISGGVLLFLRPAYLLMLLPIIGIKMLSSDYSIWGINSHYSIEFIPITSICLIAVVSRLNKFRFKLTLLLFTSTLLINYITIRHRTSKWYNPINSKFYNREHYTSIYNRNELREGFSLLPKDAVVSTATTFAPHIAFRDKIYHFPSVRDAEFLVLDYQGKAPYPLQQDEYLELVDEYKNNKDWKVFFESPDLLILKKRK